MTDRGNRRVTAVVRAVLGRLAPASAAAGLAAGALLLAPLAAAAQSTIGPATPPPAATPAAAPTGDAANSSSLGPATSLNEIVVTGTRFKTPNASSPEPITIVGGADLIHQGTAKIEDLLDSLPQTNAGLMDSDNGIGVLPLTGTSTVDLRGIGAHNTLVLMNGRRINPGDALNPSPDLHTIPEILIQRVEVETGGASSIYGSDAISGVVNFIVDTNFVGTKLLVQDSGNYYGNGDTGYQAIDRASGVNPPTGSVFDGNTVNIAGVHGFNFAGDAGHLEVYAGYRHNAGILASSRDFSACPYTETASSYQCLQSGTTPAGQFVDAGGNSWTLGPNATLTPFNLATNGYNPAPLTLLRPDTRYEAGAFGQFKFNEHAESYLELTYMHDYTSVLYGGSSGTTPTGAGLNTFGIPCNDPLLSANEVATLCTANGLGSTSVAQISIGRRNVEAGPLEDTFHHSTYRILVGLKGAINDNWTYDTNVQYGKVTALERVFNDVSASRVANALDVVPGPNGAATCASVLDGTDPNCVPYNIWGTGPVSAAALNYITEGGTQNEFAQQTDAQGQVVGDLGAYGLKSPWAADTLGLAFGAEYRDQRIGNQPDQAYLSGDLTTQGGARVTLGTYHVSEAFVEFKAPLVHGKPGIEDLSFDLSDRIAEYSPQGTANAYNFAVVYAPVRQVRFRGSYSRAIRAPNGHELFPAQSISQQPIPDPCAGPTPTATQPQCALTGVTAAEYGHVPAASTVNVLLGGNLNLKPEQANTVTAGVVFTDFNWAPSLLFSVDYWHINIINYIGAVNATTALGGCISTGNPVFCNLIQRDSLGSISLGNSLTSGHILGEGTNTGSYEESGLDLAGQYSVNLHWLGTLAFLFNGSYQIDNTIAVIPGQPIVDCTDLYGAGCTGVGPTSPIPHWRHNLRSTWTLGKVEASLNWRFIGAMNFEGASAYGPYLTSNPVFPIDSHVGTYSYFDLDSGYNFTPDMSLHLGVNNLLGKSPPIVGFNASPLLLNGNLLAGVYDPFGREIFAEFAVKF